MKNIQVIDGARNCVYDIFAATDEEFALIFPHDTDIAFIDEVYERGDKQLLGTAFSEIWKRRIKKVDVQGINGVLFYDAPPKRKSIIPLGKTKRRSIPVVPTYGDPYASADRIVQLGAHRYRVCGSDLHC
jgi:hypothetical protein